MKYYELNGQVYAYEEQDVATGWADKILAQGAVEITQAEAEAIANPPKTPEQLLDDAKIARAESVAAITVTTTNGNTFDGYRKS